MTKLKDILSVSQFTKPWIEELFKATETMPELKRSQEKPLSGKILANLFFEASTRSRMSFSSAFSYLGGEVNSTTGVTFSSISKGETLADTIKVISSYCDILVIRHPEVGAAKIASENSCVPVINAGDGPGEHPTQALLDLYTIFKEKGRLNNLTITMVGDLKYGRTVHSLSKLLCLYENIHFIFAAPDIIQMPKELVTDIKKKGFKVTITNEFEKAIENTDIIYSTRIQKERFSNPIEYESIDGIYSLNKEKITSICKPDVTIMHPLPRTNEIEQDIDELSNAAYFRQAQNGLYVRMALFIKTLQKL